MQGANPYGEIDYEINRQDYLYNFWQVPREAALQLGRTDSDGLERNLQIGGVLLTSFLLDQAVRDYVQNNIYQGNNIITEFIYNLGSSDKAWKIFAAGGGLAFLSGNRYHQDSLLLAMQSLLVGQTLTEASKLVVGRDRPRDSPDNPFSREGGASFFSGHASGVWSVLTVVGSRYPDLRQAAYGLATLTAAFRIYEDAHWLSDVVVGSLVGYGIGRLTLKLNTSAEQKLTFNPFISDKEAGIRFGMEF